VVEGEKGMKVSRKIVLIVCALAVAIGAYLLIRHLLTTDEDRIRRVVYQGKAAVEHKDIEGVLALVSRDYQDDYGINKVAIMMLFQRVFQEFDAIDIVITELRVEIDEKHQGHAFVATWATVRTQDKARYLVGNPDKPTQLTLTLAKEGGKWRVIKATGVNPEEITL
jgi:ketosteroid isomerase-like protein